MRRLLRWLRLGAVGTFFTGILSILQGCDAREGALLAFLLFALNFCTGPRVDTDQGGLFAYVVNLASADVSVIDATTNSVSAAISVGSVPPGIPAISVQAIAITPDGGKAYVANFSSASVSVIDVASDSVSSTISVGSGPLFITITPDGGKAYVTNFSSNNVSVIDVASDSVSDTINVGSSPSAIAFVAR